MNYVITWGEVLRAFVAVLFVLGLCYVIGRGLIRLFFKGANNHSLHIFLSFASGLILLVSLMAIFSTSGKTILFPVPFLLLVGLFYAGKELNMTAPNISRNIQWYKWLVIIISFSVVYFLFFLQTYLGGDQNSFSYQGGDIQFYGRVAEAIGYSGIENNNVDAFYPPTHPNAYHYFDIWTGVLFSKCFNIHPINSIVLGVYPLFSVVFAMGILLLLILLSKGKINLLLLTLISGLAPFYSGFKLFYPSFILKADIFNSSVEHSPKTLVIGFFIIFLFVLANKKSWNAFFIFSGIAAIAFINILPSLVIAVLILVCLFFFTKREIIIKLLPGIIIFCLTILYFAVFYFIHTTSVSNNSVEGNHSPLSKVSIFSISGCKSFINIIIGGSFQYFILMPFLILIGGFFFFYRKKKAIRDTFQVVEKDFFGVFITLFISGLLAWGLLYKTTLESVQFFSNLFIPLAAIFITIVLMYCMKGIFNWVSWGLIALMLLINVYHSSSPSLFDKREWKFLSIFSENADSKWVNFRNLSEFNSIFNKNSIVYQPLEVLAYKFPRYSNASLNTVNIPINGVGDYVSDENKLVMNSPFYKFKISNEAENSFLGIEPAQLEFIKENKIKYISVSPFTDLPHALQNIVEDSLFLRTSGWKIYRIK
jgi:hypothetical protein